MKNMIKIFENDEFGKVRTVIKDGEPWLVGKDVAECLGYSKPRKRLTLMLTTKIRHSPRFRAGVLRVLRIR